MKSRAQKLNEKLTGQVNESAISEELKSEIGKMDTNGLSEIMGMAKKRVDEITDMDGEAPFPKDESALKMLNETGMKIKESGDALRDVEEGPKAFKAKK